MKFILEWSVVGVIFLLLIYTMIVIKEEKLSFKENAKEKHFCGFLLLIPSWWGKKQEKNNLLEFHRDDTRYDWNAFYEWHPFFNPEISIKEQFAAIIQELELKFDEDSSAIMMPTDFANHPDVIAHKIDCVRVEGMATQHGTERRYVDIFLLRDLERGGYLLCKSISSILNGLVEGPYFEETILNLKKLPTNPS